MDTLKRPEEDHDDSGNATKRVRLESPNAEEGHTSIPEDVDETAEASNSLTTAAAPGKRGQRRARSDNDRRGRKGKGKEPVYYARRGTRPEGEPAPDTGEPKAPRLPKRQCALLIGFCGEGYNGMQMYVCRSSTYMWTP